MNVQLLETDFKTSEKEQLFSFAQRVQERSKNRRTPLTDQNSKNSIWGQGTFCVVVYLGFKSYHSINCALQIPEVILISVYNNETSTVL